MTKAQLEGSFYQSRIQRARELAARYASASEVLGFYQRVAVLQNELHATISSMATPELQISGQNGLSAPPDFSLLLPHFPEFLSVVISFAPGPLAESARQFSIQTRESWINELGNYWQREVRQGGELNAFEQFLPRAFLQPLIELSASRARPAPLSAITATCPLCRSRPLLGVLRPEGDGGKRHLVCSFCLYEWAFRRILCPWCGEEAENKLPIYIAEEFPHIKVEACETCKSYLRTIDLTKDGRAVPIVDDLAAIPLSLWADEHRYSRPEPNLLGT